MTTILMIILIAANYMLLHRLYDAASKFYKQEKKRFFLNAVQASPGTLNLEATG